MDRRRLLALASGAVVLVGAGLVARPSEANVSATCPANVAGTLRNVSRSIVPIGVSVIRGFTVSAPGDVPMSSIQLSAPPDYKAQQIPANQAVALRFTAPRAGPFVVQATWTVQSSEGPCTASGSSTLNAAAGTPITVKAPPVRRFPGVKTIQYDRPLLWTWACSADSDPTPMAATVRWEVDYRQLPLFSKAASRRSSSRSEPRRSWCKRVTRATRGRWESSASNCRKDRRCRSRLARAASAST